jgi:Leucine-rich repeat (LRR) protein
MRVLNFGSMGNDLLPINDLSNLPNLEELSIQNCWGEFTSDNSVGFLSNLKILRIKSCRHIKSVPLLDCPSLVELDLSYCTRLESFPTVVERFLGKIKTLRLASCHNLKSIPPLKLVEELDLSNCYMVECLLLSVGEFLGKVKILRLANCHNIKSIPPLKLDSLEILDLSNCQNLKGIPRLKLDSLKEVDLSHCYSLESFPSAGDGLLENIKFLNIERCIILKSIPPLRVMTSLKKLNISYCPSLESFPKILGDVRNIPELHLDNIPKKLLPLPLQNLTPSHTSYPCKCGIDDFPNKVAPVSMLAESTIEGEYICLYNGKLSDEYWSLNFMLFANMKELHLAKNQFTVLPKSMEECKFLWRLVLDDCEKLQEIKGIPPCLKVLSALNCNLLTSF